MILFETVYKLHSNMCYPINPYIIKEIFQKCGWNIDKLNKNFNSKICDYKIQNSTKLKYMEEVYCLTIIIIKS